MAVDVDGLVNQYWKQIQTGTGTYGEGKISQANQVFADLKNQVKSGKLSVTDYYGIASQLAPQVKQMATTIAQGGSKAAQAAQAAGVQDLDKYIRVDPGQGPMPILPFTRQEYAALPDSSLPTQNDISNGMFDPSAAPINRVSQGTGGTGGPGGTTGPNLNNIPGLPGGGPTESGGFSVGGTPARADEQRILAEAEFQKGIRQQTNDQLAGTRKSMLDDLSKVLQQKDAHQLSAETPGILEDLNNHGVFRSSAVGNAMADRSKTLAAASSDELAKQSLSDEQTTLGAQNAAQETYLGDRNAALGRGFSISDLARQVDAGIQVGNANKVQPQGKTGGEKVAQGVQAAGPLASAGAQIITK